MISRSGREGRGEGEDSLAYHLSNETEDVSRACFPLPTSKDGDERKECVGAAKNANAEDRRSDESS